MREDDGGTTIPVVRQMTGTEIEQRRHDLGWSQEQLAKRAKVSTRTVQNAERRSVGDRSEARIIAALEDGRRERDRAVEPDAIDIVTEDYTLTTDRGQVHVVLTGTKEAMRYVNPRAIVADLLDD